MERPQSENVSGIENMVGENRGERLASVSYRYPATVSDSSGRTLAEKLVPCSQLKLLMRTLLRQNMSQERLHAAENMHKTGLTGFRNTPQTMSKA